MKTMKLGAFTVTTNMTGLTVSQEGQPPIDLTPADIDKVTRLIGIGLGMETMKGLPSNIKHSPFVLRFFEDNTMRLERTDQEGSVRFSFQEGDEVIRTFQSALNITIDERRLENLPRGVAGAREDFIA
jgi:hypothetical protein